MLRIGADLAAAAFSMAFASVGLSVVMQQLDCICDGDFLEVGNHRVDNLRQPGIAKLRIFGLYMVDVSSVAMRVDDIRNVHLELHPEILETRCPHPGRTKASA